ncbi:CPBP family intramembrane glutamic endopeptidase [Mucilaginibacter aquaedulcis]|uniref:CPBP family intramembrane glutamic endopeptidase n=1 Tax=Mucilaginibacter aquaedulcis TaxID=1187081 RepID=UPI0025B61FF2|nr:type II CAAX endopeptidase family protein [Mucilaginibacter aquaedulcis]MDN3550021.1 type II CAAX endopeptidase family protein [Mucilaginibacter aquaedulcis]
MKTNILQKILHTSLTRIILGLITCLATVRLGQFFIQKLLFTSVNKDLKSLLSGLFVAILALLSYGYLYKFYEKRKITELSKKGIVKNIAIGAGLGAILQSLTILIIFLNGGYSVISVNPIQFVILPLITAFTSAVIEEILLRGIIFRITEERLGTYFAMAISAALFGAMHLANPHSSVIAGIGLAIQAGLLLAAAYIYKRNLWFPIAIHFAWNFTQSAIFGANVSGNTLSKTLITSKITGPEWLTGGLFGPEGSVQATLFCTIATIILLILSRKQGKIITPPWRKNHEPLAASSDKTGQVINAELN